MPDRETEGPMPDGEKDARARLARTLDRDAEVLTDEWLDVMASQMEVKASRLLPDEALRDQMPAAIRWVGAMVARPGTPVSNEATHVVRALSQLRREQGVAIEDLLREFEALVGIVGRRSAEELGSVDGLEPGSAARIAFGAAGAIHRMARLAVTYHASAEGHERRDLARSTAEYVRMIGHELKSPLALVRGLAVDLAETDEEPDDRADKARTIVERTDRMSDTLDDLAVLSRMEEGQAEESWVQLRDVVRRVFDELADAAERAGVRLEIEEPLEEVEVDASRVEVALANLVGNGIRFHDPDEDDPWVRVSVGPAEEDGLAGGRRITVSDNGLGIPRDLHNKVFQRFFRAHPHIADGTGLGLWIVRTVSERSGGRVWFESEEGRGSSFHLAVPQRLGEKARTGARQARAGGAEHEAGGS